MEQFYAIVGCS